MRRAVTWIVCVLLGVAVGVAALLGVAVRTDRAKFCEHTASRRSWTEWPFGIKTSEKYEASRIESHLLQTGGNISHRWVSYQGTGKNLIGEPLLYGHGRPKGLFRLGLSSETLDAVLGTTSSENLIHLYEALRRYQRYQRNRLWQTDNRRDRSCKGVSSPRDSHNSL